MYRQMFYVPADEAAELGKEIWRIHLDNVLAIGTVGLSPSSMGVRIVNKCMENVPQRMQNGPTPRQPAIGRPATFFYKPDCP
jgi:hypothetical protein